MTVISNGTDTTASHFAFFGATALGVRSRKFFGSVAVVVYIIGYAALAVTLVDHIPNLWWTKLLFFTLAGIGWGTPILPLLSWMNVEKDENRI